jgi:hypothetical protein
LEVIKNQKFLKPSCSLASKVCKRIVFALLSSILMVNVETLELFWEYPVSWMVPPVTVPIIDLTADSPTDSPTDPATDAPDDSKNDSTDNSKNDPVQEVDDLDHFNGLIEMRKHSLEQWKYFNKKYKESSDDQDRVLMETWGDKHDEAANNIEKMVEKHGYLDPDTMPHSPGGSDEE